MHIVFFSFFFFACALQITGVNSDPLRNVVIVRAQLRQHPPDTAHEAKTVAMPVHAGRDCVQVQVRIGIAIAIATTRRRDPGGGRSFVGSADGSWSSSSWLLVGPPTPRAARCAPAHSHPRGAPPIPPAGCRLLHTTTHHPRPRDRGGPRRGGRAPTPAHRTRTPPPRWRSASAVTVPCNIKKKSGRRSRRGRRRQRQAAASRSRPGAPRADTCAPSDVASVHRPLYSYVVVDGVASACSHAPPPDRTGDWTRVGSLARVPDGVGSEYDTPGHGMYMSRRHCTRHDHRGDSRVFICLRVRTPLVASHTS